MIRCLGFNFKRFFVTIYLCFWCYYNIIVTMVKIIPSLLIPLLGVSLYFLTLRSNPTLPKLDLEYHWGPVELRGQDDSGIRPFKVKFTEHMIYDLRKRLTQVRPITPSLEGTTTEYGVGPILQPALSYWREKYDFAARERFLNQFPQYTTYVQGLKIHFIRVKPEVNPGTTIVPLLLLHGWPGSVREFYEAIPLLSKQREGYDFALELIVPSLPGYGFSDPAVRPGLGAAEVAVVMRNLMNKLGHEQFYIQGGDWGAIIGSHMATLFPETILGYHTNLAFVNGMIPNILTLLGSIYPPLLVDKEFQDRMYPLSKRISDLLEMTGYMHIQATKPDTVGVALTDSPAGLAGYILEKFLVWTDPAITQLPGPFSLDALIDNLMYYWSSNSITTSMRLYAETFNKRHTGLGLDEIPTTVPTWALQARHELSYQPPSLLRYKYPNLVNCTTLNVGGHFIALEQPNIFADDVFKAIKGFRKYWKDQEIQ